MLKYCDYCKADFEVPEIGVYDEHWMRHKRKKGDQITCRKKFYEVHQKTFNNKPEKYLLHLWKNIKYRCERHEKVKNNTYKDKLHITKEQFLEWGLPALKQYTEDHKVEELYRSKISIDKINGDMGYTLGNLQFLSLKENLTKGALKKRLPVIQKDRKGNIVKVWDFLTQVTEEGFEPAKVCECCKGRIKTSKGYIWEYKK
jgi:hypothetical protein